MHTLYLVANKKYPLFISKFVNMFHRVLSPGEEEEERSIYPSLGASLLCSMFAYALPRLDMSCISVKGKAHGLTLRVAVHFPFNRSDGHSLGLRLHFAKSCAKTFGHTLPAYSRRPQLKVLIASISPQKTMSPPSYQRSCTMTTADPL